jgi:acetyl esterase
MKLPDPLVLPLEPAMAQFLAAMAAQPPMETLPPPVAREVLRQLAAMPGPPPAPVAAVRDFAVPGPAGDIAVRLYTPLEAENRPPLLVYLHGGGWVIGDLDSYDAVCRTLCHESRMLVASVAYRLAPEHPFPAAPDDAEAALRALAAQAAALGADPGRIAIAGDSAGAQLAAVAALRVAGSVALAALGMIYPPALPFTTPTASKHDNAEGRILTLKAMQWFNDQYVGGNAALHAHPEVSLLLSEQLHKLPPTWVATLGHDPLRDDGIALVQRLAERGVPVRHVHRPAGVHACISLPGVSAVGPQLLSGLAGWLRERLTG